MPMVKALCLKIFFPFVLLSSFFLCPFSTGVEDSLHSRLNVLPFSLGVSCETVSPVGFAFVCVQGISCK